MAVLNVVLLTVILVVEVSRCANSAQQFYSAAGPAVARILAVVDKRVDRIAAGRLCFAASGFSQRFGEKQRR